MSDKETTFIEEFRRQLIVYALIGIITVVGTAVGFYYNTQNAIAQVIVEQRKIDARQFALEKEMIKLNDRKIDKTDYIRELDEVKTLLWDLNKKIDKVYGTP